MKLFIFSTGLAAVLLASVASADEPTLVSAQCIFETTTDDKAQGTKFDIFVKSAEGNDITKSEGNEGQWDRESSHTVMLDLTVNKMKSEVANGNITLMIRPLTKDKWEFNYAIRFEFSDKSTITKTFAGCILTEIIPKRTDSVRDVQIAK